MTKKTKTQLSSAATQRAAKEFTRRTVLKTTAAVVGAAAIGPWPVKKALAADEVNVFAWSDYIWPNMMDAFTKKTGIKVNLAVFGSNDEVLSKLKATGGKGFDVVMPSVTYGPAWYQSGDLLLPIDESKINVDRVIPSMWEKSIELGGTHRGKRYLVPFDWGTEAITFDSSERDYKYGGLSFGHLWADENKGRVTVRPKSALVSIGLMLDYTGEVPSNRMLDTYIDETTTRGFYDKFLAFAIEHKPWIRQWWNNTPETVNAFYQNNCVIGQTWDGPALTMMKETDNRIRYLMPKEGGFAWLDTMGIASGAENVEQAYAWINHCLEAEIGGMFANQSGYNSAAVGAEDFTDPGFKERFKLAYPGDAIPNLWWWPPEPAWWVRTRAEYVDKLVAA
ncbi:MAG: extracellular solute-binding protein [Alphaproteobacteria bacterium]